MVFSPIVMRMALVGALFVLLVGPPLAAQEAPEEPSVEALPVVGSGTGTLESGGGSSTPLSWIETARGALVALAPVAQSLGGALVTGPLGDSYELTIGGVKFILAPASEALTQGTKILPLSQPPQVLADTVFVPLDLLQRTWGDQEGVELAWDAAAHRLRASRPVPRTLPADVSVVHVQGVTTVVLRFPAPPHLRIDERPDGWDVVALGDRFAVPPSKPVEDPFVKEIRVAPDRIELRVAPEIRGEHYRLTSPDRLVFDLYRASPTEAAKTASTPAATAPTHGIHTVVIDPGHGGSETGAIGPAGTMEKSSPCSSPASSPRSCRASSACG